MEMPFLHAIGRPARYQGQAASPAAQALIPSRIFERGSTHNQKGTGGR